MIRNSLKKIIVCGSGEPFTPVMPDINPLTTMYRHAYCIRISSDLEKKVANLPCFAKKYKTFTPNLRRHTTRDRALFMNNAHLKRYISLCEFPGGFYFMGKNYDEKDFFEIKNSLLSRDGSLLAIKEDEYHLPVGTLYFKDSNGNPREKSTNDLLIAMSVPEMNKIFFY